MNYIDKFLKDLEIDVKKQKDKAELHRPLEPLALTLIESWKTLGTSLGLEGSASVTVAFSLGTIGCISANFYLDENEGLKGPRVEEVLNIALSCPDVQFHEQESYNELSWIGWVFKHINGAKILLRFWFMNSKTCKLVPTGETKPVMKLVCK